MPVAWFLGSSNELYVWLLAGRQPYLKPRKPVRERWPGCIVLVSGRASGYQPCLPSLGHQPSLEYLTALGCHRVDAYQGSSEKPSATAH